MLEKEIRNVIVVVVAAVIIGLIFSTLGGAPNVPPVLIICGIFFVVAALANTFVTRQWTGRLFYFGVLVFVTGMVDLFVR